MAGCAVREIPEYHSSSYYPAGIQANPAGIQAARGGLAVQEILPFEPESSWLVKY